MISMVLRTPGGPRWKQAMESRAFVFGIYKHLGTNLLWFQTLKSTSNIIYAEKWTSLLNNLTIDLFTILMKKLISK